MSFSEIKELIELFDTSSIRELDLTTESTRLYLSKNNHTRQPVSSEQQNQIEVTTTSATNQSETTNTEVAVETSLADTKVTGHTISSPIVGVIYTSSEPDQPPFKKIGDRVEVGETLCIVEAMKIMNEIKSDQAGIIGDVLINNEDVVEYGQPLFTII